MKMRVLIIDDEKAIRLSMQEGLNDMGHVVKTAGDGKEGLKILGEFLPHTIFLDIRLPDQNGIELIETIKENDPEIQVVMMTAYGDIPSAVTAIKKGAFDYMHKPFDLDEVQIILEKIGKHIQLRNKLYFFEREATASQGQPMIGEHASMREVENKIKLLGDNDDVTVLIRGETGTGKELVASAIHKKSLRRDAPFVSINCASLSQTLIESELFGHEKNAFTGAATLKKGLLEIADGGTVFLDEIGDMDMNLQTKLLRVLEERKFKRVGGVQDIEVDLRIIAATNKNLEKAIEKKEFREDLYYRLNVVPVELPPLRERGKDLLLIARYFLETFNRKFNKEIEGISPEAEATLLSYHWRGNIRELKNIMERIVLLHSGKIIEKENLPVEILKPSKTMDEKDDFPKKRITDDFSLELHIQQIEKAYLQQALEMNDGNHTKASELLGISRFAMKRKIEKYNL